MVYRKIQTTIESAMTHLFLARRLWMSWQPWMETKSLPNVYLFPFTNHTPIRKKQKQKMSHDKDISMK